jgi:sugar (pentulose or hexulose) kinase
MEFLLGIDVGTTSCKAVLVTPDGAERAHGWARTPWQTVPTGAEVDARALVDATLEAAREAVAGAGEARVAAVGVTSMAETGILLDRAGEPVAPAIAWHDSRGEDEAAALAAELGEDRFVVTTGLPATRLCSLAKLRWLREHEPAAARGVRWLNVGEWIVRALGGDELAELSLASRTGFLDRDRRDWWPDALSWAGVTRDFLPEPSPAGTAAGRASGTGVVDGAVLAVAGHDHLCAAIGAGATSDGDLFDSCGSAEALVRPVAPPVAADDVRRAVAGGVTVGWHAIDGRQALLGGFLSGLALGRFLDLLGIDDDAREELDAAAIAAPAGAGGLTVADIASDRASLVGIGAGTSPGLVWRAALEAAERHAAAIRETIAAVAGPADRLVVTGGWARDAAVQAVKRELLGDFDLPQVQEAGARGAALLAGCAAGIFGGVGDLPPLRAHDDYAGVGTGKEDAR